MTDRELKTQVRQALDMAMPPLPEDPDLTDKVLEAHAKKQRVRQGRLLGLRVAAALAVMVLVVCGGLIYPQQIAHYLKGTQSDDEQHYVVQGVKETPSNLNIAEAQQPGQRREDGSCITQDLSEAVTFWGSEFLKPTWLPDGWNIDTYTLIFIPTLSRYSITLRNDQVDHFVVFDVINFYDTDGLNEGIEQNGAGRMEELPNGISVYITANVEEPLAIWLDGLTQYLLVGPISEEDLLHMVYSVYGLD